MSSTARGAPRPSVKDVRAPTVWEEGTWSGTRVTRLCVLLTFVLVCASALVHGELGPLFDVAFVVLCVFAALAVHPRDSFRVGVLPPFLLLGTCLVLAFVWRDGIARADDNLVQAVISGLAHRSGALFTGYALALVVIAIRQRVLSSRQASNLAGSPAPYRVTSGTSPEKSTTVVGEDPHSPQSTTASIS